MKEEKDKTVQERKLSKLYYTTAKQRKRGKEITLNKGKGRKEKEKKAEEWTGQGIKTEKDRKGQGRRKKQNKDKQKVKGQQLKKVLERMEREGKQKEDKY